MNKYIYLKEGTYEFYVNKTKILEINIDSNKLYELNILRIKDATSTTFTFPNQEKRDKTMRDILSNERQTIATADEGCDH